MQEYLQFATREEFRDWLTTHYLSDVGVWLLFGKAQGPKTCTAREALEEALCYGWIDGQMKSLNEQSYLKYFSKRRPNSKWSDKNKRIAMQLVQRGTMTEQGFAKIEEAKQNGQWYQQKEPTITEEHIAILCEVLRAYEPAYTNFQAMSLSVRKTYTKAYLAAKTETGRKSRIAWMVERLNQNLKPM